MDVDAYGLLNSFQVRSKNDALLCWVDLVYKN
jgi:hypothetical protein